MNSLGGSRLAGEQLVRAAAAAALDARARGPVDDVGPAVLLSDRHRGQLRLTDGVLSHLAVLI